MGEFQEIILMINENNFMGAKEIFENLLLEKISERMIGKKEEVIEKLKLGNLNEQEDKVVKFIESIQKKKLIDKLIKIPNLGTDYDNEYVYIHKLLKENYIFYLLKTNKYNSIEDIEKYSYDRGNTQDTLVKCLYELEDVLKGK